MVYIVKITYPYEYSEVIGVYSSYEGAEIAKDLAEKKDYSGGYNCFDIEEHEVNE